MDLDTLDVGVGGPVSGLVSGVYLVEIDWGTGSRVEEGTSFCLDYWEFSGTFEAMSTWTP